MYKLYRLCNNWPIVQVWYTFLYNWSSCSDPWQNFMNDACCMHDPSLIHNSLILLFFGFNCSLISSTAFLSVCNAAIGACSTESCLCMMPHIHEYVAGVVVPHSAAFGDSCTVYLIHSLRWLVCAFVYVCSPWWKQSQNKEVNYNRRSLTCAYNYNWILFRDAAIMRALLPA